MKKRILIVGQCTLQLGRMEYGNIGNYYILEPLVRCIRKTFPDANLFTTFQLTKKFSEREKIISLPIDLYYSWGKNNLKSAYRELEIAKTYNKTSRLITPTPYINEVLKSNLIIDFSGDIWGDNADLVGKDRFLVGLIKDRVAQLLKKKTIMLAGSPGPFNDEKTKKFAKEVYRHFDLVTNRESISTELLEKEGFDISKTKNLACPSFLFEISHKNNAIKILKRACLINDGIPIVGFVLCGWNFKKGPFDKKNRKINEYIQFVEMIEYISENHKVNVCLMSHSNGFTISSGKIKLIHGRDYKIIKKVEEILKDRGIAKNIFSLNEIYDPKTTKAIIGNFDILISGRIHGAVAALSQAVPTVIIDYGHEPKAHKVRGFSKLIGVRKYLADPSKKDDLISKFRDCWSHRVSIRKHLDKRMPWIKKLAWQNFDLIKSLDKKT